MHIETSLGVGAFFVTLLTFLGSKLDREKMPYPKPFGFQVFYNYLISPSILLTSIYCSLQIKVAFRTIRYSLVGVHR